jgi:hypothetical protein
MKMMGTKIITITDICYTHRYYITNISLNFSTTTYFRKGAKIMSNLFHLPLRKILKCYKSLY